MKSIHKNFSLTRCGLFIAHLFTECILPDTQHWDRVVSKLVFVLETMHSSGNTRLVVYQEIDSSS